MLFFRFLCFHVSFGFVYIAFNMVLELIKPKRIFGSR